MPRDKRLYMTFPIDIHRHPKMQRLTPAAKWAFVEMNGEARIAGNDGRFAAQDAEYLWTGEVLDELLRSHPTRPLVTRDGTDYVIRDYAEHQQTAAVVEQLSAKRAAAGRQGAAVTNSKRSANAAESAASAAAGDEQMVGGSRQVSAESELETELVLMTDTTTSVVQVTEVDARVEDADRFTRESDQSKREAVQDAQALGIRDLADTRQLIESRLGYTIGMGQTVELCRWIISKSSSDVVDGGAYVGTVVRKSPARVREMAASLDIGQVA